MRLSTSFAPPHLAALLISPLSLLSQANSEVPRQEVPSSSPLIVEVPTEPTKKTFFHAVTEPAERLFLETSNPICFEVLDRDFKRPEHEAAGLNSSSIEAFTAKLQKLGFKCTRTADYVLVQSATDELLNNPLDERVRDFEFKGTVEDLKFKLLEYIPPPASTGSNLLNRMGEVRTLEFRIKGGITVRELLLKIAAEAKLRWMVIFETSHEQDGPGHSRRKVKMARLLIR